MTGRAIILSDHCQLLLWEIRSIVYQTWIL